MEAFVDVPWAPDAHARAAAFGEPHEIVRADALEQVRPALARVARACDAGAYAVGFVAYEAAAAFDAALVTGEPGPLPLVWFGLHAAPVAARMAGPYVVSRWRTQTGEAAYLAAVDAVRAAIARGDTYQVNHTMRLGARLAGDPLGAWRDLCVRQGEGWFAYVDTGEHVVASASPELFFTRDGGRLVTRPMKGTRRRDADVARDAALRADLVASAKDRAENLMIVDLLRNDLARVCQPGVQVSGLLEVEAHPTVWQLTSTVSGRLRAGVGLVDLFDALFPCGSVTGAPKASTMGIIAALERRARGPYCGAVGVVWPGGDCAFNVAIRTLVLSRGSGSAPERAAGPMPAVDVRPAPVLGSMSWTLAEAGSPALAQGLGAPRSAPPLPTWAASYDVGGGVVWDSVGADEHAEALTKAAVLDALAVPDGVRLLETMAYDGRGVVRREGHLRRLLGSAAWLGWEADRGVIIERLTAVTRGCYGPARVRLTLGPDGALDVTCGAAPDSAVEPVAVTLAAKAVWSGDPWLVLKTTRRARYDEALEVARREHPHVGDVVLHNERGEVTETTIGNLVVELDGELVTPPAACGLLPGVLRAELLASGRVRERVVRREELGRASRVWRVNSLRGWARVSVDDPSGRAE